MAVALPAHAQDARRVGVVITTAVNVSDTEADALADELGAALSGALAVDVISGHETRRRLPTAGLPDECVAEPACRQDLGQRLDAPELLLLVVVRIGDRIQIDATWANVASGNIASRPAIVLEAGADRASVFTKAAPTLLPHMRKTTREPDDRRRDIVVVTPGTPSGTGRHMTTGSWIATGVAGAAIVGGTVFALSARSKFDSLEADGCRVTPCAQERVDSMDRHALAADMLYGAGIAAGVTAVVLYMRSGSPRGDAAPADVTVQGGPGQVGLSIGGQF